MHYLYGKGGGPTGNRTPNAAVTGRNYNRLTTGPQLANTVHLGNLQGSSPTQFTKYHSCICYFLIIRKVGVFVKPYSL